MFRSPPLPHTGTNRPRPESIRLCRHSGSKLSAGSALTNYNERRPESGVRLTGLAIVDERETGLAHCLGAAHGVIGSPQRKSEPRYRPDLDVEPAAAWVALIFQKRKSFLDVKIADSGLLLGTHAVLLLWRNGEHPRFIPRRASHGETTVRQNSNGFRMVFVFYAEGPIP